jgi:hypothetical protein
MNDQRDGTPADPPGPGGPVPNGAAGRPEPPRPEPPQDDGEHGGEAPCQMHRYFDLEEEE